jgi:hypothetical protein
MLIFMDNLIPYVRNYLLEQDDEIIHIEKNKTKILQ